MLLFLVNIRQDDESLVEDLLAKSNTKYNLIEILQITIENKIKCY